MGDPLYRVRNYRKSFGFCSESHPQKFAFRKYFRLFRMETENLAFQDLSLYLLSSRKSVYKNWLSNRCPGKPESQ